MKSKMRIIMSVLAALMCAMPAAAQNDTLRLSRAKCVEIALQENPTIKVADMEVKRMDYSKKRHSHLFSRRSTSRVPTSAPSSSRPSR